MSKSRDESRAVPRTIPKRYPNLVGDGFCESPGSIIHFLDKGQRRHILERLGPAMQELAEKRKELGLDMLPEAHRGKKH